MNLQTSLDGAAKCLTEAESYIRTALDLSGTGEDSPLSRAALGGLINGLLAHTQAVSKAMRELADTPEVLPDYQQAGGKEQG